MTQMLTKEDDKRIKRKLVLAAAWLIVLFSAAWLGYDYSIKNTGFRPSQPVAFSHKAHIEKYGMKCLYCHYSAERASYSNLPTTYACMVCHVALRNETDLIKPLNISHDEKIPVKWNDIYRLPDYAHFEHSRHIRAMIDCASCHGEVEKTDSLYQSTALTMKWCLDCHRNPKKFIIPAREVSGIFQYGLKYKDKDGSVIVEESKAITEPGYGLFESKLQKQAIKGIPMPKLPGKGPETCSACHF